MIVFPDGLYVEAPDGERRKLKEYEGRLYGSGRVPVHELDPPVELRPGERALIYDEGTLLAVMPERHGVAQALLH